MYPLTIIITVGILRRDRGLHMYVLPMSILGAFIAFYQVLLANGILPEAVAPCALGNSCTVRYVGYFGFITIPVMSLAAFAVITASMFIYKSFQKK